MSVDVHKFGYSPKGVSCVVYRSPELRRFQYHSTVDFSGGLYTTPTMQGSRSGAVVAAAWATMVHIGTTTHCALCIVA
jgi:sphinganine-1-phosphate aldolase